MVSECGVSAVGGMALGHVAGDAFGVLGMRRGECLGVAGTTLGADIDGFAVRLMATAAPKLALAFTRAGAQRELFHMTHDA